MPKFRYTGEMAVRGYIKNLMEEKGVVNLTAEQQLSLEKLLEAMLRERMDQGVIASLSEEQFAQLDKMTQEGASDEAIAQFIGGAGIDYERVAQLALNEFREEYLNYIDDYKVLEELESRQEVAANE